MDRKELTIKFTEGNIPDWLCPTCEKGILLSMPETVQSIQSIDSQKIFENIGEPEVLDISISIILKCNNQKCEEKVICIAKGNPSEINDWNENSDHSPYEYDTFYEAIFFYPFLKIFKLPILVPEKIKMPLHASFELFFCNPSSSLNNLRMALEELLNQLEIKKYRNTKKGRLHLSLHERISLLENKFLDIKDFCLAIKWHGNAGSHSNSIVSRNDVLDAYEIFKVILDKVFDDKPKKINDMVKKINKQKGILNSKNK